MNELKEFAQVNNLKVSFDLFEIDSIEDQGNDTCVISLKSGRVIHLNEPYQKIKTLHQAIPLHTRRR